MRIISVLRFCFVLLFLCQCLAKSVSNNERIKRNDNQNEGFLSEVSQKGVKLLIVMIDGFRWDYVSSVKTLKGFPKFALNGVSAKYVKPIFPTKSYPNWYTIVTGLYAESHGMIANTMYDKTRDDLFLGSPQPNSSHTHFWNKAEPLWITAQKNGIQTAMYLWDGCQVKIDNTLPFICHKNRPIWDWSGRETRTFINTILDDFSNNKYRLALLYYEFIDRIGHAFGPESEEMETAIHGIDDILNDLYESIERLQLNNELNVVLVSDHGMISIENFKRIYLKNILEFNDVDKLLDGGGPWAQILPKQGKEKVLKQSNIKGLNVYLKENIPERFHYKNDNKVLPILLTADEGYLIHSPRFKSKAFPDDEKSDSPPSGGNHGFDPDYVQQMWAIMYGFGPAFKNNYTSEPLSQVDHYNLFCHILGIKAKPNNGSLYKMKRLLKGAKSDKKDGDVSEETKSMASSYNLNLILISWVILLYLIYQ